MSTKSAKVVERGEAFDGSLLRLGADREAVYALHPLITDAIQIATPPLKACYDIVHRAVSNCLPGINFAGPSRIGKTTAQAVICKQLAKKFPKVPVGRIAVTYHTIWSEIRMWTDIAEGLGLATTGRDPGRVRTKILNAIATQCAASGSSLYVLLCDEVQNWNADGWTYMKDLGNLLRARGIRLITVGFGQEQLYVVKDRLKSDGRRDLIGRFLKVIYPIAGIQSQAELQEALSQLDDPHVDFPTNSRICYSEFFMPKAYAAGWRLANEAANFWAGLDVVSRGEVNRAVDNVSMSSVVFALKEFFLLVGDLDHGGFESTRDQWVTAVERSDFADELC